MEQLQLFYPGDNPGYELNSTGTGSDDGNPFTIKADVVVPASGVEYLALEGFGSLYVGTGRLVQLSRCGYQRAGLKDFVAACANGPQPGLFIENSRFNFLA